MKVPADAERQIVEQSIGRFILDLGMIEATMIQALAVLVGVPQAQAHFLLNKTAGGAKVDLITDAARAKGIDLKATGLKDALGAIHKIMAYRNRITHDAIGYQGNKGKWIIGRGTPSGDAVLGENSEIDPAELKAMGEKAWAAIKVLGIEILEKHGDFKFSPGESQATGLIPNPIT